ncbi:MAG TPA: FG-GAP-like repeat-containing protein, partial [Anaerolineae bacterium]
VGSVASSAPHYCCFDTVTDLDGDGKPEIIVNGNVAYHADGSVYWDHSGDWVPGYVAAVVVPGDPYPEIVTVANDWDGVRMLNHDGILKWGPIALAGGGGGSPVIADFNRDGVPDIGVAGRQNYEVLDGRNGNVLWTRGILDNSYAGGSAAFDFDGSGVPGIVYRDEYYLYLFRGNDGAVLWQTPNPSGTAAEYPVVADVDGDGHAEVVVGRDQYWGHGNVVGVNDGGLYVFGDSLGNWRPARSVWNAHDYHLTNVTDDGRVTHSAASANTFRTQAFPEGVDPFAVADPLPARFLLDSSTCPAGETLLVRVTNAGSAIVPRGIGVGFYDGVITPTALLVTTTLPTALKPGDSVDVSALWTAASGIAPTGDHTVIAYVNDPNAAPFVVSESPAGAANDTITRTANICSLTNHPPVFTSTPVTTAIAGQVYHYQATATDADNDPLLFDLPGAKPPTMGIIPATGLISWQPTLADLGPNVVMVRVADGVGGVAYQSYVVTVVAPTPPTPSSVCENPGINGLPGNSLDANCNPVIVPPPAGAITATLVTDKPTYHPHDSVQLISAIYAAGGTTAWLGLTATLTVRDPSNAVVFQSPTVLPPLGPGAYLPLSQPFNVGSNQPGLYSAQLQVLSGAAVAAQANTSFTVMSSAAAVIALTGILTPAPTVLQYGQAFTVNWLAVNAGNVNLTNVQLQVAAIEPVSGSTLATSSLLQPAFNQRQVVQGVGVFSSLISSGPVLLVLLATYNNVTQTLATSGVLYPDFPLLQVGDVTTTPGVLTPLPISAYTNTVFQTFSTTAQLRVSVGQGPWILNGVSALSGAVNLILPAVDGIPLPAVTLTATQPLPYGAERVTLTVTLLSNGQPARQGFVRVHVLAPDFRSTAISPHTRPFFINDLVTMTWVLRNTGDRDGLGATAQITMNAKLQWQNVLSVTGGLATYDSLNHRVNWVGDLRLNQPVTLTFLVIAPFGSTLYDLQLPYDIRHVDRPPTTGIGVAGLPYRVYFMNSRVNSQ